MPKKKTPVRSPWTKADIRQLKAHSKARTPVVDVEGDEANRGRGPAKGEDNRHWSWPSPLRTGFEHPFQARQARLGMAS
jgi:hypothetical protein